MIRQMIKLLARGPAQPGPTHAPRDKDEIEATRALLKTLDGRSYLTYMARLRASIRLAYRNRAWNAALISASGAVTVASVALLVHPDIYGRTGPTLLVLVSILALIASLVTSSLNYSARSRDMFHNYRRIQALSAEVERAAKAPHPPTSMMVDEFNRRYDALLDESENHTTADHKRALHEIAKKKGEETRPLWREPTVVGQAAVSAAPYVSLVIPALLIAPLLSLLLTEARA